MLIRREDMDAQIVDTFLAGIAASFANKSPTPEERSIQRLEQARFQPSGRSWLPLLMTAGALGVVTAFLPMIRGLDPALTTITAVGGQVFVVGMSVVAFFMMRRGIRSRLDTLHSDLLAGWLPFIEVSRAERAYCETLVLLSKPNLKVDDATARAVLADMNRLLASSRRLDAQRAALHGSGDRASLSSIQAERALLAERLQTVEDPEARASLAKSLELCTSREGEARALTPTVDRLESQQELIIQTFGSIQSTLARLDSAHQALAVPEVDEIQRRVTEMSSEAYATESAVQEVIALQQQA
jgi:hypothetical protein